MKLTKFIKKWLNLPRCLTQAAIYHPDVLQLPFLPQIREQAKLSMVTALEFSSDPFVKELLCLLKDPSFLKRMNIPTSVYSALEAAQRSVNNISMKSVKISAKSSLKKSHAKFWDDTLDPLQVQSKFKDIVSLEPESHTWNRILSGLPAKQLSFLLRAGTDCLPTPLNLHRWHYRVSNLCPLCVTPQILNGCQEALIQGRYTWRHDSILNCLSSCIKSDLPSSSTLYVDIPTWRASDSPPSMLPLNITTTSARPDLVLELTVPFFSKEAPQAAKQRKSSKESHLQLISDLEENTSMVNTIPSRSVP